jgi:uncharacterized membrane protein YeaQ/YmgE (transglycosylase-associated protein family)
MEFLWFILIGLIAGWLAGQIMKGGGYGVVGDIVVGIIGALLGGWLCGQLGIFAGGLIGSLLVATLGAIIFIFLIRLIKRTWRSCFFSPWDGSVFVSLPHLTGELDGVQTAILIQRHLALGTISAIFTSAHEIEEYAASVWIRGYKFLNKHIRIEKYWMLLNNLSIISLRSFFDGSCFSI